MNSSPITFAGIFNTTFKDDVKINAIEIPIIQRDYAQGRESKEVGRIRTKFLSVLHDALVLKSDPVKLDFVYGNISEGKLIPLDGQQRLTTLFLLHWYLAKKEKIEKESYQFLFKFTYQTRFSSAHFCENLMKADPDFSVEKISNWIKDQSWYMYSWDYDPTICAMLVMLDDIHAVFQNDTALWQAITSENNPAISFYFLPLEDMGLTDSLYIKMNSRGKPLTEFEHFKAEFEAMIKAVSMELYNEFVQKVDNDWVDMLWKYRGDDDAIDDEFMRYFRFVTEIICFQADIQILENDFDLARDVYNKQNNNAVENLKFLFKALDCWKELNDIDSFFNSTFSKQSFQPNKVVLFSDNVNLFLECCNKYGRWVSRRREFTLNNTILLYAILTYLLNCDTVSEEEFIERIRIVRNLVLNSPDEIREDRMQALLNDTGKIIIEREISLKNSSFNEIQKNQEIQKIAWRKANSELIDSMNKLEDHSLLQGNIAIIGLENAEKFDLRATNFSRLFNGEIKYASIRKALLSIDDYSQLASWRFLLGNSNASSWKELFTPSKQRKRFDKTQKTLLQLLDAIDGDSKKYIEFLHQEYLSNPPRLKDWRYYFIKYQAMRTGNSGVYYWHNDPLRIKDNQYEVVMMNTPLSTSGRHWNPFLYILFRDADLKGLFSMEEYGAPLIVNKTAQKIRCKNSAWEIYDSNDILVKSIDVSQENGTDIVDRIELMKEYIKSELN